MPHLSLTGCTAMLSKIFVAISHRTRDNTKTMSSEVSCFAGGLHRSQRPLFLKKHSEKLHRLPSTNWLTLYQSYTTLHAGRILRSFSWYIRSAFSDLCTLLNSISMAYNKQSRCFYASKYAEVLKTRTEKFKLMSHVLWHKAISNFHLIREYSLSM